jgi:hypothetical protein
MFFHSSMACRLEEYDLTLKLHRLPLVSNVEAIIEIETLLRITRTALLSISDH